MTSVHLLLGGLLGLMAGSSPSSPFESSPEVSVQSVYRELRDLTLTEGLRVENLLLKRDVGEIRLISGTIVFGSAILDRRVCGVFVGDGEFRLSPTLSSEVEYLRRITEEESVVERFDRLVLWFTDNTYEEILAEAHPGGLVSQAGQVLEELRSRLRRRTEEPRSLLESLLHGETVENLEAEVLTDLLGGKAGLFDAYIFGKRYRDLRFLIRPRGALPQLPAPEEIALIHVDPMGKREGIWYLAHFLDEHGSGRVLSEEDTRIIDVDHYRIETTLNGSDLEATAELTFSALQGGERVLHFDLLPSLRAQQVQLSTGDPVEFIQEGRKADGSLYVILPKALETEGRGALKIRYSGNKVIQDAGGGNWAVEARSSWYPSINAFGDRATFQLVFRFPKNLELVSVGNRLSEKVEGKIKVAEWVSDLPIGVAGFNYGRFKQKNARDEATGYELEGFAVSDLPYYLRGAESIGGMSPSRLIDNALVEAQNSLRIYAHWFGGSPYGRIALTQQPQFNFGQSWPGLVYLPLVAFLDSTQRWRLLDTMDPGLRDFVEEVTAHEVAHQWWGHLVGWKTFHDQWLSEGMSDFATSLYLEAVEKAERTERFWEETRKKILEEDSRGKVANEAGPISMGLRLITYETPNAYNRLVYRKGAFVVHMLRRMMLDESTGDHRFRSLLRDFVDGHRHANATTESFQRIVERHMTPAMDLDGNGKMDWFFNQWVHGTEIPSYELSYSLEDQGNGGVLLRGSVAQTGVSERFKMLVPIYLELGGRVHRIGQATLLGKGTTPEFEVRLPARPSRVFVNAFNDVLAREVRTTLK